MFGDVAFAQAPFASLGGNAFNVFVSETSSIASSTAVSSYIATAAISETASTLSTQSPTVTLFVTCSESASGLDVFDTLNNIFNVIVVEALRLEDSYLVQTDFVASRTETASAAGVSSSQANFAAALTETASAAATAQAVLFIPVLINETASAAGAYTNQLAATALVREFAAGLDGVTVVKTLNVTPTGVQLVVSVGNVFIWSQVNDNQDPNWQNVSDLSATDWVLILNPSTPGWNDIPS